MYHHDRPRVVRHDGRDPRRVRPGAGHGLLLLALAAWPGIAAGAGGLELRVSSVSPAPNALAAPVGTAISVQFDQAVDPASIGPTSFHAFGRWSGPVEGAYGFADGNKTVTLVPDAPLSAGEMVMVTLSHDILAAGGAPLRAAGHAWQFWTAAAPSPDPAFIRFAEMTTRTIPSESSRAYGGIGTDLDNDGWLDLTIVNEDTSDLRVFMNLADGSGLFSPFLQPTFPVNDRASPSEPADFNFDGNADIAVVNINTNSVSILLGNGDGTFAPQQEVTVGAVPRGIAVLDADGDGDVDVVNTNSSGGSLSLLLNDGQGVFGPPTFLDGGVIGEWSLAAADMNEDGILDLVVGGQNGQQFSVVLGEGGGSFAPQPAVPAGGRTWMIALGDVNGDGHVDVSTANSSTNSGAILLGDGAGGLGPAQVYATDPFPLATDLGDVDGDGDLDWVTSSFGGDFFLFLNDGQGGFAFLREFAAPSAASCALMLDLDNDCDLDLALVDELADVVMLERNLGPVIPGDLDGDGQVGTPDLLLLLAAWGPCPAPPATCPADLDGSGGVGTPDLLILLAAWGPCP